MHEPGKSAGPGKKTAAARAAGRLRPACCARWQGAGASEWDPPVFTIAYHRADCASASPGGAWSLKTGSSCRSPENGVEEVAVFGQPIFTCDIRCGRRAAAAWMARILDLAQQTLLSRLHSTARASQPRPAAVGGAQQPAAEHQQPTGARGSVTACPTSVPPRVCRRCRRWGRPPCGAATPAASRRPCQRPGWAGSSPGSSGSWRRRGGGGACHRCAATGGLC